MFECFAFMHIFAPCVCSALSGWKRKLYPQELEIQMVVSCMWVTRIKNRSHGRAEDTINDWAITLRPIVDNIDVLFVAKHSKFPDSQPFEEFWVIALTVTHCWRVLWLRPRLISIYVCKHKYLKSNSTSLFNKTLVVKSTMGPMISKAINTWLGLQYKVCIPAAPRSKKKVIACLWDCHVINTSWPKVAIIT